MSATFTDKRVTSLRHKDIGRRMVLDREKSSDFGWNADDDIIGTIESLSMWKDGVSVGFDTWNESERCIESVDVEYGLDESISIGGAS
jgi:hypothetical protein